MHFKYLPMWTEYLTRFLIKLLPVFHSSQNQPSQNYSLLKSLWDTEDKKIQIFKLYIFDNKWITSAMEPGCTAFATKPNIL